MNRIVLMESIHECTENRRAMNENDFDRLAREHLKPLYSYCLSLTCDPHRAEELAQETLVRAYHAFPSLHDPYRFFAWMRGIARRCTWTWWRKAKRNPMAQQADIREGDILELVPDPRENPAERLDRQENRLSVLKALKRLSFRYREVVTLRYFEELSYADIALRLDISIDAVDQRLTRAKLKLRRILHPMEL